MKCNRSACQKEGALWFNYSTRQWYCAACARKINKYNPGLCELIESGIAPTKTFSEWAAERGVSPTSVEVSGMLGSYFADRLAAAPMQFPGRKESILLSYTGPQDLQHLVYDGTGRPGLSPTPGSVRP